MIHQFQFQEYICAGIGECNLERRILIANNIRRNEYGEMDHRFYFEHVFYGLFGELSVVTWQWNQCNWGIESFR